MQTEKTQFLPSRSSRSSGIDTYTDNHKLISEMILEECIKHSGSSEKKLAIENSLSLCLQNFLCRTADLELGQRGEN